MNTSSLQLSQLNDMQKQEKHAMKTLAAGDAFIKRSYLSELGEYPVMGIDSNIRIDPNTDLRIFRIERIVQNNKQSVLESTTAAYTALGAAGHTVFLFLHSDGQETKIYIGTKSTPNKMLGRDAGNLLLSAFKGHFSGSDLKPMKSVEADQLLKTLQAKKADPAASVTAVTGVPALSTTDSEQFMQGLERLIDAAEHHPYQALILAEPISSQNLDLVRMGYEDVATQLSPLLKRQLSFSEQESDSVGLSISQSISDSLGTSLGLTETRGTSHTTGTSTTETNGTSESHTSETSMLINAGHKSFGRFGAFLGEKLDKKLGINSDSKNISTNNSVSKGYNESHGTSWSESASQTNSTTKTTGTSDSQSINKTNGTSRQVSLEVLNKTIEQLLSKIDHHLERIDEAKTYGGWNSAAYFIGDDSAASTTIASIFLGLVRGNKSSHEDFALTTWTSDKKSNVIKWLENFNHPQLEPSFSEQIHVPHITPATLISGKEMAIHMSLPRRSTSTVSVVETQAFGRQVRRLDNTSSNGKERKLILGNMRHLWENLPQKIELNLDQLSSHVFVSGSTGAGKSNTLYEILNQISIAGIPFLVIEPAKGEYKHVFGNRSNVKVFGTNPIYSALLKINPFRFPVGIHVLEHVDRLVEIFNVCWPMYAAMPAVLKDAILQAYQESGWDLDLSTNRYNDELFPTFLDLLHTLQSVIKASEYSEELKSNYIGSLSTRIKSLTNGLNGQIFSANEIDNDVLFNKNVIIDLSRVGSSETKALIMGILVMRLSEHRIATGGMNQPLRHVTILEEAHNILKRSPTEGGAEGAGLAGKSVEMLTNAIAEMRTYGEGFIIVDQSPSAVDIAAIRNTNTKIIMRLPDETDRRLVGKSVALRDEQLDEIAKLPKGVAIVYQNDWLEPVLCQIKKFDGQEEQYSYKPSKVANVNRADFNIHILRLVLAKRIHTSQKIDTVLLEQGIKTLPMRTCVRIPLLQAIDTYQTGKSPIFWQDEYPFAHTAKLIVDTLDCRQAVQKIIQEVSDYSQLCTQLDILLRESVNNISGELSLATQHCLMKDLSLQHERYKKIYSAWKETAKQGAL